MVLVTQPINTVETRVQSARGGVWEGAEECACG